MLKPKTQWNDGPRTAVLGVVIAVALLSLAACQSALQVGALMGAEGGADGVCNIIRDFGETAGRPRHGGGFVCRTTPGPVQVTAHSSPHDPNSLDEVLIEGQYPRQAEGTETKQKMVSISNAIFKKLNMAVPPGITVAIQNRSRGEAMSGRLLITVDHTCAEATAGSGDPCRIAVWIRKGTLR